MKTNRELNRRSLIKAGLSIAAGNVMPARHLFYWCDKVKQQQPVVTE